MIILESKPYLQVQSGDQSRSNHIRIIRKNPRRKSGSRSALNKSSIQYTSLNSPKNRQIVGESYPIRGYIVTNWSFGYIRPVIVRIQLQGNKTG